MRIKLLYVLFLVSSYTFAQNWSQVGLAQFTNFASDGAMTFDSTNGDIYVAYTNILDGNKVYVSKFDGTSWISIGAVSADAGDNVAIKLNPLTNEPTVAYKNANDNMSAYRYNGTTWTSIFTDVGSSALSDHRLQIQFNAAGTIRVAGREWTQKLFIVERDTAGTGPNHLEVLLNSNNQYNGDHRYDYTAYDEYFVSQENNYNGSVTGRKNVGSANNSFDFSNFLNGTTTKNISGIYDSNYHAFYNDIIPQGAANNDIRVYNGSSFIKSETATNGIVELRKSLNDNKLYLMYANSIEDIVFENYDTNSNTWSTLPTIGLNSSASSFFVKMAINEYDGNLYVLYQDGPKISMKKYTIVAPLNLTKMYVDVDATGTNDGSSWANAYTSLTDALDNIGTNTTEMWLADGTYTPTGNGTASTFNIVNEGFTLYGGFDGTETQLSERDVLNNAPTILEGDVNGNDVSTDPYHSSRADNIRRIITQGSRYFELNGVTVQGGNSDTAGAAIFSNFQVGLSIKNCKFLNNSSRSAGIVYFAVAGLIQNGAGAVTNFNVENSEFSNNSARYWGQAIYCETGSTYTRLNVTLVNNLFFNNIYSSAITSPNEGTATIQFHANNNNSTITGDIVNCTFANNTNLLAASGVESAVIGLSIDNGSNNVNISNCIVYDNTLTDNTITPSVGKLAKTIANQTIVSNSIGEDSFSNLIYLANTSNANPLFTSSASNYYTLQGSSTAVDTGDSSKIPAGTTTDLAGNSRIFNTSVDMGVYEYNSTLSTSDFELNTNEISLYPNPVKSILNIKTAIDITNISIYSLLGKEVITTNTKMVNISSLSNGVYLIKIIDVNGNQHLKRFIKE